MDSVDGWIAAASHTKKKYVCIRTVEHRKHDVRSDTLSAFESRKGI